jgi:hypothetical protein
MTDAPQQSPADERGQQGRKADGTYSEAWRNFTRVILPPTIRAMMALDWHGQEQFPARGGMILAANHLSYMDVLALELGQVTRCSWPSPRCSTCPYSGT